MSIATEYAAYGSGLRYGDLPDEVVAYAKTLLRDYAGVAVGGRTYSPSADAFLEGIRALDGGNVGDGGATVLATGERLTPAYAALLNGALAHSLDFDDTEAGHPGAPVISAALAAAEEAGADGRDLLAGIVAGYEVTCRLYRAVNLEAHYGRGFHPTATCGLFGATVAAGRVRGLDEDALENALGLNASQASGIHGYVRHGGWNKRLHPGLAAHAALLSVSLADAGFRGTGRPFDGYQTFFHAYTDDPRPDLATEGLGERYRLLDTGIKPYPCCRLMHTAIDLALALASAHDPDPDAVDSVTVDAPGATVERLARPADAKRDPSTLFEAQFSLPFGVALALARRDAGLEAFTREVDGGYGATVGRLMDRVEATTSEEIASRAGDGTRPATVAIAVDGDRYVETADHSKGDPGNPLTREEHEAKFRELAADLSDDAREAALERIATAEDLTVDALTEPFGRAATVPEEPG